MRASSHTAKLFILGAVLCAVAFGVYFTTSQRVVQSNGANDGLEEGRTASGNMVLVEEEVFSPKQDILTEHETPVDIGNLSFVGPGGQMVSLDAWQGKTLVLNVWASWCAPCITELPSLEGLRQALDPNAFDVIAVSTDRDTTYPRIVAFLQNKKMPALARYYDQDRSIIRNVTLKSLPITIVVGPDGREIARYDKPLKWDDPKVVAAIKALQ